MSEGSVPTKVSAHNTSLEAELDDSMDEGRWQQAVFGVLYTVSKEKRLSPLFVAVRLLLDVLQLWLLIVQPQNGYLIRSDWIFWRIISLIGLNQFYSIRGYTFFLASLYIMIILLAFVCCLCVWVGRAFRDNTFTHVWPIQVLRVFGQIFFQVLDVATMSLLLIAMDCQYFATPEGDAGFLVEYPDVYCWTTPHLLHLSLAAVSLVVFLVLAWGMLMADMELNLLSHENSLAMHNTSVETNSFLIKFVMAAAPVFINNPKWQSVVMLLMSLGLLVLQVRWLPHYNDLVNKIRAGSYTLVFFCAMTFVLLSFQLGLKDVDDSQQVWQYQYAVSILTWVGMPVAAAAGWGLAVWRLSYFNKLLGVFRLALEESDGKVTDVWRFKDHREVEILVRLALHERPWQDQSAPDADMVELADYIMKCGLAHLNKEPFMFVLSSSFLIDVQSSYQSGFTMLQSAKKLNTTFSERFAIFCREQERVQKTKSAEPGEESDLIQWVEFQRALKMTKRSHREALQSISVVWTQLCAYEVKFASISKLIRRMDEAIREADRTYRTVMQRHSTNVQIVKMYASYLENVKNDPWKAARWYDQAKQAEMRSGDKQHDQVPREAIAAANTQAPAIIINAQTMIMWVNNPLCLTFGYNRTELKDKSVSVLMPSPLAELHSQLVRRYVTTGEERLMNKQLEHMVLNRAKQVLPIGLKVTRLSGISEDLLFLGVFTPMPIEEDVGNVWVSETDRSVLCTDSVFSDLLGWTHEDLTGKPLSGLVVGSEDEGLELNQVLTEAVDMRKHAMAHAPVSRRASQVNLQHTVDTNEDDQHSMWTSHQFKAAFTHKFLLEPVIVDMWVKNVGSSGVHAMWRISVRRPFGTFTPTFTTTPVQPFTSPAMLLDAVAPLGPSSMPMPSALPSRISFRPSSGGLGSSYPSANERSAAKPAGKHDLITNGSGGGGGAAAGQGGNAHWSELMLVVDNRGTVIHVTQALAGRLNTPMPALLANGTINGIEGVIAEPFALMHRRFLRDAHKLGDGPAPAFSCRSGITVMFMGRARDGKPEAQPFKLRISEHRPPQSSEVYQVAALTPTSVADALAERRVVLRVDTSTRVTAVLSANGAEDTGTKLFGFKTPKLVGKELSTFLDVFAPASGNANEDEVALALQQLSATGDVTSVVRNLTQPASASAMNNPQTPGEVLQRNEAVLMELARLSQLSPGTSYRVGVLPPASSRSKPRDGFDKVVSQGAQRVPAIMAVRLVKVPISNGAAAAGAHSEDDDDDDDVPTETILELELWRADRVTSVIDVDSGGFVLPPPQDIWQEALYPPWLVQGLCSTRLVGKHLSDLIPRLKTTAQLEGCRNGKQLEVVHAGDQMALKLRVQSSRKRTQLAGTRPVFTKTNIQLVVRTAETAACGRPDFCAWVLGLLAPAATAPAPAPARGAAPGTTKMAQVVAAVIDRAYAPDDLGLEEEEAHGGPMGTAASQAQLDYLLDGHGEPLTPQLHTNATFSAEATMDAFDTAMRPGMRNSPRRGATSDFGGPAGPSALDAEPGSIADGGYGAPDAPTGKGGERKTGSEDGAGAEVADDAFTAGVGKNNYQRGQRYKRLGRMLNGRVAMGKIRFTRNCGFLLIAAVVAVQTGCFVVMLLLMQQQMAQVLSLSTAGKAARAAAKLSTLFRRLEFLTMGMAYPRLPGFTSLKDIPVVIEDVDFSINELMDNHRKSFDNLGGGSMPETLGMWALWNNNTISTTTYRRVNESRTNSSKFTMTTIAKNMSLWDVGNTMSDYAQFVRQNYPLVLNTTNVTLAGFEQYMWIYANSAQLSSGYLTHIDILVQIIIDKLQSVNQVQLYLLAVNGVACGLAAAMFAWFIYSRLLSFRLSIYCTFLIVPPSWLRNLAASAQKLSDDNDDEDEDEERAANGADAVPNLGVTFGAASNSASQAPDSKGANSAQEQAQPAKQTAAASAPSFMQSTFSRMSGAFGSRSAMFSQSSMSFGGGSAPRQRRITPSVVGNLVFVSPFLAWMVLVCAMNGVGYMSLGNVGGDIATAGIITFLIVRCQRGIFNVLELAYWPASNPKNPALKVTISKITLPWEWQAALYGGGTVPAANGGNTSHFQLATNGIALGRDIGGALDLVYHTTDCLCAQPRECQPPSSIYYSTTRNGLERIIRNYINVQYAMAAMTGDEPTFTNTAFELFWNIRQDAAGGLDQLADAYNRFLTQVFGKVTTLHVASFALTLAIMLVFCSGLLLPLLAAATNETRRIAELLSQLPRDIDIESEVQAVIAKASGETAIAPEPAQAAEAVSVGAESMAFLKSPSVTLQVPSASGRIKAG